MRKAPRRVLALDQKYAKYGGVAVFVLAQVDAGARVPDLAEELSEALGEYISPSTVYGWIERFQRERKEGETVAHTA